MNETNTANANSPSEGGGWRKELTGKHWKTLFAAFLGWALDIMDLMLYSFVIVYVMKDLSIDTTLAGVVASGALVASAFGGIVFGILADKYGRIRSMTWSIILYSAATALCGFSQTAIQLLIFRILVGLGMGGEYASGASLVTETWPAKYRARAMAFVQCGFTIGVWLAAVISMTIIPVWGWRAVFFVGALPALMVFWIRRHTPESELWQKNQQKMEAENKKYSAAAIFRLLFVGQTKNTLVSLLYITFIMLGYWGLTTWAPAYLAMPIEKGGRGLSLAKSGGVVILMKMASVLGYASFGIIADKIGLKPAKTIFILGNAFSIPFFLAATDSTLLTIATLCTGYFVAVYAGFGPMMAELFPTEIRATASGALYNIARAISGLAPIAIGGLAVKMGLGNSLYIVAAFYAISLVFLFLMPPLKGAELK